MGEGLELRLDEISREFTMHSQFVSAPIVCSWSGLFFYHSFSLTFALLVCGGNGLAKGAEKPNIIFVLFDDMGYGQPPSYRADTEFHTPNLERLTREGMRFTDAHSASAVCTPTRYGVLTGRYPWRIGQYGVLTTYSAPIIPASRPTVASLLKQQGYHTACIGKWHLGMNWDGGKPGNESQLPLGATMKNGPNAVGFDYFYGFTHARNIGSIIEQDRVVAQVEPVENQPLMLKKALAYLEERAQAGSPFFLYFPMCPPHTPIVPAAEFAGKGTTKDLSSKDKAYSDWLYQGDAMLGQIMETLERLKLAENTLLIATSDNGAEQREYPPLRAAKRSIYEGGHRVPFVARWPGKVKAGSVNHHTICLNDLLATSAEIVGAPIPPAAGEDSVSLLPHLFDPAQTGKREATVHQSMAGDLAIRQGPWKLVFLKNGIKELYNLETDIREKQNVAASNVEIANKLTKLLQSYVDRGRSTPGAEQENGVEVSLPQGKN